MIENCLTLINEQLKHGRHGSQFGFKSDPARRPQIHHEKSKEDNFGNL